MKENSRTIPIMAVTPAVLEEVVAAKPTGDYDTK
jgi:hypothetical protein